MIHYYLGTSNGEILARQLDDLSAVALSNQSMVIDMSQQYDDLLVEVNSLEFNTEINKFQDNLVNQYRTIRGMIALSNEIPKGVTQDLLKYMQERIPTLKRDMNLFDEACLNTNNEKDMHVLNDNYILEKRTLNLVYALSKANLYIHPEN